MSEPFTLQSLITAEVALLHKSHCDESLVWREYTGLKDKNSTEIYEGDIVREYRIGIGCGSLEKYEEIGKQVRRIAPVLWSDEELCFMVDDTRLGVLSGWGNLEVVSNIYEHPNLIPATDTTMGTRHSLVDKC